MTARNQSSVQTSNGEVEAGDSARSEGRGQHTPGFGLSMSGPGFFPDPRRLAAPTPLSTLSRWQMGTRSVACRRPDDLAGCVLLCAGTLLDR